MIPLTVTDDAEQRALKHLVEGYLRAEREEDVEAILAVMTDDVEHELLGAADSTASVRGKGDVRARYFQRFANTTGERTIPLRRLYGEGFVVDEMVWEGRITGRLGPLVGGGRRVSHKVLNIFEMRDGQISRVTEYTDVAAIMRQLS